MNNPDLPFAKAYSYGKSTKNQRIEAWWNLLTEGQTQEWKIFFAKLEGEGLFDDGDIDKLCLQYIYMDMIRSHIHQFVVIHNTHSIRRQRLRAHYLPTGQPFLLYHYPNGVRDYKEGVNLRVLSALEEEVKDFDLDEYLPTATLRLYAQLLSASGYPNEFDYGDVRHRDAYIFLRQKVANYLTEGGEISLLNTPSGAEEWIYSHKDHEIEEHREIDQTMIVDETDDECWQEEESQNYDMNMPVVDQVVEERLSQLAVNNLEKGKGLASDTELESTEIQVWDSGSEEDCDEINDGYFLNL